MVGIGTWQLEASLSKYLSLGASQLKWVTVCGTPHPQSWCKVSQYHMYSVCGTDNVGYIMCLLLLSGSYVLHRSTTD